MEIYLFALAGFGFYWFYREVGERLSALEADADSLRRDLADAKAEIAHSEIAIDQINEELDRRYMRFYQDPDIPPSRCKCGSALVHVIGGGVDAQLCPSCDRERVDELTSDE